MKKNECINLRVSEQEKNSIKKQAKKNNMNMTDYILQCVNMNNSEKVIAKTDLAAILCNIAAYLDNAEVKDSRLAKRMRGRFNELWELL